jgi:transposase
MKVENIDINKTISKAREVLKKEKNLSPAFVSLFEVVLLALKLLADRVALNSSNSSKPPSQDPNRDKNKEKRKTRKDKGKKRKPGAQPGHKGVTLEKNENPDEIEEIEIDLRTIPAGDYKDVGYDSRQVFDVEIKMNVKEYRAQILEEENTGNQFVAVFPDDVTKAVQYGNEMRAQAVYMSIFQMIPLARILDYFKQQGNKKVSKILSNNSDKR